MHVLGLSCYYHDAAACLVRDGAVVAAAQEERFNRRKYSPDFPLAAINYCLQAGEITIDDVDHVAFYEKPFLKLERVLLHHVRAYPRSFRLFLQTLPGWLRERLTLPITLKKTLGYGGRVHFLSHHLAHAGSSFLASPFEEAAILTADGVGEWATTTVGHGRGSGIQFLRELRYPDSLGLLYTAVTTYLGFEALAGEGKVMALADFGEPAFLDRFRALARLRADGSFRLDRRYFPFYEGTRMFGRRFVAEFGPPREAGSELTQRHRDIAASLQRFLEEALLNMARTAFEATRSRHLCLAGGVCLNVAATSRIREETPFADLFIQPAAGDAGGALGAALFLYHALTGAPRAAALANVYVGPNFSAAHIRRALRSSGIKFAECATDELVDRVGRRIAAGKIVGWFRGRMEFGPRALGCRSILADPSRADMKDKLNAEVKHRESFRPYGVSLPREDVNAYFELDRPSPFMLQVARVRPEQRARIPAALHVNGTSRIQTLTAEQDGAFYALAKKMGELNGAPLVLNTSFNDRGEPIVCTPEDALRSFQNMSIDCLALENFLLEKDASGGA
jgi:carbamoyltransferase